MEVRFIPGEGRDIGIPKEGGRGSSQRLNKQYEFSVYLFVPVPTPACSMRVLAAESKILRAQWLLLVTRIAPLLVGTRIHQFRGMRLALF